MSIRLLPLAGLGVLAVLVTAGAITRTARERIASVGLARLIARWFTGTPWHGGHVTDAGWNRPGRKADRHRARPRVLAPQGQAPGGDPHH